MKKLGTILLTGTCSLGAGYYFGLRHSLELDREEIKRGRRGLIQPPVIVHHQQTTTTSSPSTLVDPQQNISHVGTAPVVVVGEDLCDSTLKTKVSGEEKAVVDDENLKPSIIDDDSTIVVSPTNHLTTLEEIYQYLEQSGRDDKSESIRWPKYNIQFLSDDTEENREKTIQLFKTFDGFGIPTHAGHLNLFSHFISVSDSRMKIPLYVAWTIPHIHDNMTVTANRKYSRFMKGAFYDHFTQFNPDNNDYFGSGYSRGHLANCGDFVFNDQKSMNDTHLLIHNIVPQNFKNNAGYWLRMERFTRSLAFDFDSIHVIAGPAIIPEMFERKEVDGKLQAPKGMVKHLVVGKHQVTVPTHLFRIIIAEKNVDDQLEYYAQAFLVPNTEVEKTDALTKYSISLQELERITGLKFLDKLEKSGKMLPLCKVSDISQVEPADITPPSTTEETVEPAIPDIGKEPIQSAKAFVKYGCNCDLPPWQDMDVQDLLWKKNVTEEDIQEKWKWLLENTKWEPSRDIVERKNTKLEELKAQRNATTISDE